MSDYGGLLSRFGYGEGLLADMVRFDWSAVNKYKDKVVEKNSKGVSFLFRKNGVEHVVGTASIAGPGLVDVVRNPKYATATGLLLAAQRGGIGIVLIPKDNEKDLADIPAEIQAEMKMHFVETMDEVLEVAHERPLAAAAVPPFAVSANRGAFLTLALGLAYVAARRAYRGDARPLLMVAVGSALTVVILVLTPLGGVVATRLTGAGASDSTRESLYGQAWDRTTRSPLIGYGEPVANDPDPPIGTHGLVWYAMVAHGIPGLLLLLAALVALLVASARARTQTALWAHAAILIGVIQAPVYGLLPQIVVLGLAAGICWREDHPELAARG